MAVDGLGNRGRRCTNSLNWKGPLPVDLVALGAERLGPRVSALGCGVNEPFVVRLSKP